MNRFNHKVAEYASWKPDPESCFINACSKNWKQFTYIYCFPPLGVWSCGETYIGETIRNVEEHWSEHNSADNKSEPAKHLADNKEHSFLRSILLAAPKDNR